MSFANTSSFTGARVVARPATTGRFTARVTTKITAQQNGARKVISFDDKFTKNFIGTGLFVEDQEVADKNYLKKIESKKILSQVEKAGLLSLAEKNGLTLTKLEQSGLLSKAEELGLLGFAETLLTTDPGLITAASIPPLSAAVAVLVLTPDTNIALTVGQDLVALGLGGVGLGLFAGGYVVATITE